MVFVAGGDPERPLGREDRRAYQLQLKHFLAGAYPEESGRKAKKIWAKLQSKAKTGIDNQGRPVLEVWTGESRVQMGVSAENVLKGNAPAELERDLLTARLQAELEKSTRGISETEVARDWELLQKTMAENVSPANGSPAATRLTSHSENTRGNRP
jgi:hypothetical protein